MKNNAGSPKKRPKRRHKKKQTKSRKRSLQQRLARMAKIRQALAAIRSDNHSPMVEPEPEKPLPTPTRGKPLWDVTINSANAPYDFGGPRPQLPPKSPDRVTIRLPSRAIPFTVVDALYHQPAVLRLRSSTGVLVLLSAEPCDPPQEPHTQCPRLSHTLCLLESARQPGLPPPRLLEPPPEQPLPHDWPPLPCSQPPGRALVRLGSLKELTRAVIGGNTSSEDQVPANREENTVHHKVIFKERLRETIELKKTRKQFRKKSGFIQKWYQPHKRRFSPKSINTLKKQRSGLSDSRQSRRYATKTPRLPRAAGKALLKKHVKLLASEIKQHSELFTPVSAAELLVNQQSSLGLSPATVPLKPEKLADNAAEAEQLPFDDREDWESSYKPVFRIYYCISNELSQPTKPSRKKAGFVRKAYQPNKKRFFPKSSGSLKKPRTGLSDSRQPRHYAMKTPRLSQAAGKALLTKHVKLLAPEIKPHSALFTPVSAAELLMKQRSSLGRCSPAEVPLKSGNLAIIAGNAAREEQAPTHDEDSVHHEVIFRKRLQENKFKLSLTTNSSDVNSDQLPPDHPAAEPMRLEPNVDHSPAKKSLKAVSPAVIVDQLPSAERVFDKRAAKLFFREHYELTKTTSGKEWEFREAEKLFLYVCKNLPKIKQRSLDEFGRVPEEFFSLLSTEIAQYELGLTRQDEIIRDILQCLYNDMADFDRLLHSLTELQTANSSDTNSDPFTPDSPAAGPIRQEPSAESSSAEKPLKSIYPAIIADQLPNAERKFPRGYAKYFFRKHYGLTKTTSEKEWEFREAEKLFIKIHKNLPKLKQRYLDEFGGVPEEFFSTLSTEIAQYEPDLMTQQDEIIRDIVHRFSQHMAHFDQLVQSLAASGLTAPGALDSPANPPGTVTASLFLLYPKQDTLLNNND